MFYSFFALFVECHLNRNATWRRVEHFVMVWMRTIHISNIMHPAAFIFRRNVQIAPNFLHWNAHIFLFWLNPTGHSKFHNTSNHPPPATDSGRTAHTPMYPSVQAAPPLTPFPPFFPCPGQRNRRRLVPVPMTGVRYNSLLWMCTLNTLTWPDLTRRHLCFSIRHFNVIHWRLDHRDAYK